MIIGTALVLALECRWKFVSSVLSLGDVKKKGLCDVVEQKHWCRGGCEQVARPRADANRQANKTANKTDTGVMLKYGAGRQARQRS